MYTRTAGRRWIAAAAVAVVVATIQIVTTQPAAALPALVVKVADYSGGVSPVSFKWVEANCPAGQVVVGGGAEIIGNPAHTVVLTGLEPHTPEGLKPYRFVVYGAALVSDDLWNLRAYALCVNAAAMQPYRVVEQPNLPSSGTFKSATVPCPAGMVAYSAGGSVSNHYGGLGLQLVRTSGPLDIGRATARVTSSSITIPWSITTYAVCGPRKDSIAAAGSIVNRPISSLQCPPGQQLHGAGGGLGLTDGGPPWIRDLHPVLGFPGSMTVQMTRNNPSSETLAHATCATRTS
jgi:hypothetical protein